MITINSNEEAQALIRNAVLAVDDDIEITFDGFNIDADIKCRNIYSKNKPRNITAHNLNVWDISANDLNVWNITANNLNVGDIKAHNLNVHNLDVLNINADNIDAVDIIAKNISYYAICFAYNNIYCNSIKGRRPHAKHFCLDGEITITGEEQNNDND